MVSHRVGHGVTERRSLGPHATVLFGVEQGKYPDGNSVLVEGRDGSLLIDPSLSVRENLDLGSYRRGASRRAQNRERIFSFFPRLRERSTQRAGTLSGGEQQMLAIGRGLMAEPKLMIMDEPSLGLSPLLVEELFALIKGINADGVSILLVEQNVVQSLELADRAYILAEGKFVMSGLAKDIGANPELKRAYLGM